MIGLSSDCSGEGFVLPVSKKTHPDWVQLAIRLLQWGICILLLGEFLDSFFTLSSLCFLAGAVLATPPVQQKIMRGRFQSILCLLSLLLFAGGRLILPPPLPIDSLQTAVPSQTITQAPAQSAPIQVIMETPAEENPSVELLSSFIMQAMAGQTPSIPPTSPQEEIPEEDDPPVIGESQAMQSPAATVPEAQTGNESTGQGGDLLGSENNTAAATYVLNTNSMKFHHANCRYASRISPENYRTCSSREEAIAQGFIPCGVCNP